MSASVNKIILIGNVGKDPAVNVTNGHTIGSLSIATTRRYSKNGERQEETEWHYLTVFDKLAEIVQKYVKKGTSIYVCGRIRTRKWQAESGEMKYRAEVVVEELQILSGFGAGERETVEEYRQERPRQSAYQANATHRPMAINNGMGDLAEDIPF